MRGRYWLAGVSFGAFFPVCFRGTGLLGLVAGWFFDDMPASSGSLEAELRTAVAAVGFRALEWEVVLFSTKSSVSKYLKENLASIDPE